MELKGANWFDKPDWFPTCHGTGMGRAVVLRFLDWILFSRPN